MATITRISDGQREAMRRNALGSDQSPTAEEQANGLGGFPLDRLRNGLGQPQDPTNVSFPFLRRMKRDHMVSMGLHFIGKPLVAAKWYYQADSAQIAAYADKLIRPIYGTLLLTILRMLWAGYSPGARTYQTIQPQWVYYDGNEAKKVWENGPIDAIVYKDITPLKPEIAMPSWDATGNFNGINYDKRFGGQATSFIIDGKSVPSIDLMHSFWITHDKEDSDGSPYGFPRIAHAAPIFYMYRYMWTLIGRAFENSADPGPVMRYPQDGPATIGPKGDKRSTVSRALSIGQRKRSGSTIALPSDPHRGYDDKPTNIKMWDVEYPEVHTDFTAMQAFIGYLETAKLRALWIQEQGLVEGSGSSSNRNVAKEFGDQRDASQIVLMQQIDTFIDEVFVKPVISMVFPNYQGEITKKTFGIGDDEANLIAQIIQLVGQQNYQTFGIDLRLLAEAAGYPMLDPAEHARQLKAAADLASKQPTPPVEPTQGRRSLVTQTGFGETVYHQLGDQLPLADVALNATDDGDFVADLPKTDVFADYLVVQEARKLRAGSKAYLAWLYRDFAIYLARRRTYLYEESELDGENFLDSDAVGKIVARVMNGWRPSLERVAAFQTSAKARLKATFERVSGNHAQRHAATKADLDEAAAQWLEDQGARMVKQITDTTREQLAEQLADGVRDGKTAKEIARDIKDHFEDFPTTRASRIALFEIPEAYNFATVQAGKAAGITHGQLIDGNYDAECRARNGRIVPLSQAADQHLNHPYCQFHVKLLARAPEGFSVRRERLSDGLSARYDQETETALIDIDLSDERVTDYMLALGEAFSQPDAG